MKIEQNSTVEIPWTWADQISSYKFWGLCLFLFFMTMVFTFQDYYLINLIKKTGVSENWGMKGEIPFISMICGIWLAWVLFRLKIQNVLYLYSLFLIISLIMIYLIPSYYTLIIFNALVGISYGAIIIVVPIMIIERGGSIEMIIVSFGLILSFKFFAVPISWVFITFLWILTGTGMDNPKPYILFSIILVIVGTIFLIPLNKNLFNTNPPQREFSLTPLFRNPVLVGFLCSIPFFNLIYIIYLSYRFHGEVNSLNPNQNILSPAAGALAILFLAPIIVSSINDTLTSRLIPSNNIHYHKTGKVIFWAFLVLPISFALIQSNLNKLINQEDNANN